MTQSKNDAANAPKTGTVVPGPKKLGASGSGPPPNAGPPKGGPPKSGPPNAPPVVEVRPVAEPARMRKRHWGLMASFVLLVLAPLGVVLFYLWFVAEDQYSSTVGFTVRQEEGGSATELLGGLGLFTGGGGASDSDILYEFIQSQGLVERVDARENLRTYYSQHWRDDPVFSIRPDATIEDLVRFWQRIVRISYDQASGLIELQVLAFDAPKATSIAEAIVGESQDMINALNEQARNDAMRYALADLDDALDKLKSAREALTRFRTRTQIVDPDADIQGRMGVMNNLQQQLAESLIEFDLLGPTTTSSDPRLVQARRRIEVIRARIESERETFATDTTDNGAVGEDYPSLIAEFESLVVDREYAEQTYRAALTALDVARSNSNRQSRYLAAYSNPTVAESSEFPQRGVLTGLTAIFLLLFWGILALVYYSIRDRR